MANDLTLSDIFEILIRGIPATITVTVGAFLVGLVLGAVINAMKSSRISVLRAFATAYVEIFRGIPPIVWLFIIFFGIGSSTFTMGPMFAAVTGLGLVTAAYMAEIYRAALGTVPRGQKESAIAIGLGQIRAFRSVILPQAVPVMIPPAATYLVGLIKDSSLASVIGAQEITFRAYIAAQNHLGALEIFMVTAVIYLVLSVPVALFSRALTKRSAQWRVT